MTLENRNQHNDSDFDYQERQKWEHINESIKSQLQVQEKNTALEQKKIAFFSNPENVGLFQKIRETKDFWNKDLPDFLKWSSLLTCPQGHFDLTVKGFQEKAKTTKNLAEALDDWSHNN